MGGGAGPAVAPAGSTCPGGPAGVCGDPAGERCPPRAPVSASAAPLGPGDEEDAPAGAAADERDLPRGSLAAGLRYPEPCLLLFPSPVSAFLCLQMKLVGSVLGRTLPPCAASVLPSPALCCLSLQLCINECLCTGNLQSASGRMLWPSEQDYHRISKGVLVPSCQAESAGFLIDWKAGTCSDLGDLSSERTLFRPFLA